MLSFVIKDFFFFFFFILSSFVMKDADPAKSLLLTVYNGIAPGDSKSLPSLDINTKKIAEGLLQLAFSISQMVSAVRVLEDKSFI